VYETKNESKSEEACERRALKRRVEEGQLARQNDAGEIKGRRHIT